MEEFKRSMFFTPWPLKFRESANERREDGFVVLTVEPRLVPSLKGGLHWEVKEAGMRARLETHTSDNLAVSSTRLIFQEVALEKRKIKRNAKKCLTKMDEDGKLENGIRVEID
jgi:hypothetical protein